MNNIGKRISELRKTNHLSQQDLANKLNVSNKTISKWECGNGIPDIEYLSKISEIFNITLDELVKTNKENDSDQNKIEINENLVVINKENSLNKKKRKRFWTSLITTISIVFILGLTTLLCYFFIPRNPRIEESTIFEIDNENQTATCVVDNNAETFSFNNIIEVPRTNTWSVYYDINGLTEIKSKTVDLQVGNNTFYIIIENNVGEQKIYQINIRRKPLYVITFNTAGGEFITNQIVQEGDLATYQDPVREGYIFNGWDYDFSKPINSNITITANWIAKNLTITYFSNFGNNISSFQDITYDSYVTLKNNSEFIREGYTLESWNTKDDGSGTSYSPGTIFNNYNIPSNINLYAQWSINQYNISVIKNINEAGQIQGVGNFDYNSKQTLSAITNAGYTWIGWYSNDVIVSSSEILEVTIPDTNIEFTAVWSANKYLISLDVNNGNTLSQNTKELIYGEHFTLPTPTREEAIFLGWFDSNNKQYTNNLGESIEIWDKPYEAELIAHYKINEYQLTLNTNNNNAGSVEGSGLKEFNSNVTIVANTNAGYKFVGWFNGTELITSKNTYSFVMSNYPITYTAKWEANDYEVTMIVDNDVILSNNTENVTFDTAYTLPIPEKNGYIFNGWYSGMNATGVQLTDNYGNSTSTWSIPENTLVYPMWELLSYRISYSLNDGKIITENATSYTIEDLDIYINNPIRDGYIFEGWIGSDLTEPTKELIIEAGSYGDKQFGAVWSQDNSFIPISNISEFLNIKNNLDGNYYLTQNINLEGSSFTTFGGENNPFTGIIDGCGYSIINLSNTLFYYNKGYIYNINFENATITGSETVVISNTNDGTIDKCKINASLQARNCAAAIVINNNGTIRNCYIEGLINVTRPYDNIYIANFAINNYGNISYCYSSANLRSYADECSIYCGAYVVKNKGVISNSFIAGDITAVGLDGTWAVSYATGIYIKIGNMYNCYESSNSTITKQVTYNGGGSETIKIETSMTNDEYLKNPNFINYGEFISNEDMIINPNNIWIFDGENYPKLYWEV